MGSGEQHWRRVEWLESLGRVGDVGERSESLPDGLCPAGMPVSIRRAIAELEAVLTEDDKECWHTKTAAIRSLVSLADGGAAILKTLARDSDPDVRQAAIEALGALGFAQAARLLQRIAADEADPLRELAARALKRISLKSK